MGCDLEVDVNGEQVFMVDKLRCCCSSKFLSYLLLLKLVASFPNDENLGLTEFFSSFSSRFSRVFGGGGTRNLKLIFHNFPGGAEGFDLMAKFCYNNGTTVITPSNVVLLNCTARFMETNDDSSVTHSLVTQTEKLLGGINHWTWSELLIALKQCQDLLPTANSSSITKWVLDCLVKKLAFPNIASPFASSSETSSVQFTCDTESTELMRNNFSQTAWWFDHLVFLNTDFIQKVVRTMISQEVDHAMVSKFVFYYQKLKSFGATPVEKQRLIEVIISLLYFLDRSSVSLKGLFNIYHVALSTRVGKKYRNKLESLIGSQLDEATINYLLVPSSPGKEYSYDVNMVKRLVKAFLVEGGFHLLPIRLNKVSMLMDLYLVEVAPDSHLNPAKFLALTMLLPDCARGTHDRLYRAIDMYLQVHAKILSEEAKVGICSALNHDKLSAEALKHLARNSKFPPRTLMKAFIAKDSKLRNLLHEVNHLKTNSSTDSLTMETKGGKELDGKQILVHAKKTMRFSEDLQEMDWKAMELDKVCGVLQSKTADIVKSRISVTGHARYLPKICST